MKRDPVTVDENYTVREAALVMIEFAIENLLVTSNRKTLGAVTYRDIIRYLIKTESDPNDTFIGEITDQNMILVRPNTPLEDAITLMLETDRNTLPVVDSEIVGYISYTDILRAVKRIEAIPIAEEESFDTRKFLV
jgi:CBS domain-containing protein